MTSKLLLPTLDNLKKLTNSFFELHWNETAIGTKPPYWSGKYTFQGGNLPNYEKQGVYAFVRDDTVTYIGVGISSSEGRYAGRGLTNRMSSYMHVVDGKHTPKDSRLVDAGSVVTIGFDPNMSYLAAALEVYLIGRLATEHNVNRPGFS